MRRWIGTGLLVIAVAGCADARKPAPAFSAESTEGTTMVRAGVVNAVLPPAAAGAPSRLLLRYDDGGSATIATPEASQFLAGDRVRVITRRNAIDIEKFEP